MSNRQCASVGMGLFLVAILLSIAYLPQFATIIFVSLILHSLLVDTVDSMSAGRMPRALAALSVLGCFVLLMVVVFVLVSATVVPMGQDFINRLPQMVIHGSALGQGFADNRQRAEQCLDAADEFLRGFDEQLHNRSGFLVHKGYRHFADSVGDLLSAGRRRADKVLAGVTLCG